MRTEQLGFLHFRWGSMSQLSQSDRRIAQYSERQAEISGGFSEKKKRKKKQPIFYTELKNTVLSEWVRKIFESGYLGDLSKLCIGLAALLCRLHGEFIVVHEGSVHSELTGLQVNKNSNQTRFYSYLYITSIYYMLYTTFIIKIKQKCWTEWTLQFFCFFY